MNITAVLFVLTVSLGILAIILRKISFVSIDFFKDEYEDRLVKHKEDLLKKIDECFDDEKLSSILPIFKDAFCLNTISNVPKFLERVHFQNISLLARMIALSHDYSAYIKNLKTLETILDNHQALLEKRYKKISLLLSIKSKKKFSKNSFWAVNAIKKEIKELDIQIEQNKKNFFQELAIHVAELGHYQCKTVYQ